MQRTGNNYNNQEEQRNRPIAACASCKYVRRRCDEECVMAPHFPECMMQEFKAVHAVFGLNKVTKILKNLDFASQKEAVKSLIWEALWWRRDPVHGPLGEVKRFKAIFNYQHAVSSAIASGGSINDAMVPPPPPHHHHYHAAGHAMNFSHEQERGSQRRGSTSGGIGIAQGQYRVIQERGFGGGVNLPNPSFVQEVQELEERQSIGRDGNNGIPASSYYYPPLPLVQGQEERVGDGRGTSTAGMYSGYYDGVGLRFGHAYGGESMRVGNQGRGGGGVAQTNHGAVAQRQERVSQRDDDNLPDHSQEQHQHFEDYYN